MKKLITIHILSGADNCLGMDGEAAATARREPRNLKNINHDVMRYNGIKPTV